MLIPSANQKGGVGKTSLSRRVNANSQPLIDDWLIDDKLIKKGEC